MRTLYVIPARGGSKGIPKKNIKLLDGKPLICYSIDAARLMVDDEDICVSTDSKDIIDVVESYGIKVQFKRPSYLSEDHSGTQQVLEHALDFFEQNGQIYESMMLLQPTSPFRLKSHLQEINDGYSPELDMVVSVAACHYNPYFSLFEENEYGFLKKSKSGNYQTRQDTPPVYNYNGSMYLINAKSLKRQPMHTFEKVKKYLMNDIYSVDIDTPFDWAICETIIREGYLK